MAINPYPINPIYQVYSKVDVYTLYQNLVKVLGNATYYGQGLPTVNPNIQLVDVDLYKWFIDLDTSTVYHFQNGGWTITGTVNSTARVQVVPIVQELSFNTLNNLLSLSGSNSVTIGTPSYTFLQSTPLTTWFIEHNLAKYPSVTILDTEGNEVYGNIDYLDNNNIQIVFSIAFSGTAYLN